MLKESHKFDLTLIRLTSNFAEMLLTYFRTIIDKNCAPKVLDERVTEKFVAEAAIVFFEYA